MARARPSAGPWRSATCPTCSATSPRCPRSSGWPGSSTPCLARRARRPITKTGFWWEAPDGSTVRAEYLPVGYGNGAALPDDAKALVRRVADHEQEIGSFLLGDLLLMNGSDHLAPPAVARRVVAEANALQDDYVFEITSLPEYLADAPRPRASSTGRASCGPAPGPTC